MFKVASKTNRGSECSAFPPFGPATHAVKPGKGRSTFKLYTSEVNTIGNPLETRKSFFYVKSTSSVVSWICQTCHCCESMGPMRILEPAFVELNFLACRASNISWNVCSLEVHYKNRKGRSGTCIYIYILLYIVYYIHRACMYRYICM